MSPSHSRVLRLVLFALLMVEYWFAGSTDTRTYVVVVWIPIMLITWSAIMLLTRR